MLFHTVAIEKVTRMNDHHVRSALRHRLDQQYARDPETIIVDEFAVRHGSSRIDVAVINCALHGFEIKSDRDTLYRLPNQVKAFSAVLDQITLLVGYRHAYDAFQIVPEWWGVVLVDMPQPGKIELHAAREPKPNPCQDAYAVTSLLWRNEALALLEELGLDKGLRSAPRRLVYQRLTEAVALETLCAKVRQQLRNRAGSKLRLP